MAVDLAKWMVEALKHLSFFDFITCADKKIGGEGDNDERRARACYLFWLSVRVKQLHFSQTDRPQFSSSNNVWSSTPFCKSIDEDHWPNVCTHFPKTLRFEWALGKEKDKDRLRKTTPYKSSCVYILLGGRWSKIRCYCLTYWGYNWPWKDTNVLALAWAAFLKVFCINCESIRTDCDASSLSTKETLNIWCAHVLVSIFVVHKCICFNAGERGCWVVGRHMPPKLGLSGRRARESSAWGEVPGSRHP